MPNKTKNLRTAGQTAAQKSRTERNKKRRIARNQPKKGENTMNAGHILAKLGNRYRRLKAKLSEVGPDLKKTYGDRMDEIQEIFKQAGTTIRGA